MAKTSTLPSRRQPNSLCWLEATPKGWCRLIHQKRASILSNTNNWLDWRLMQWAGRKKRKRWGKNRKLRQIRRSCVWNLKPNKNESGNWQPINCIHFPAIVLGTRLIKIIWFKWRKYFRNNQQRRHLVLVFGWGGQICMGMIWLDPKSLKKCPNA